MSIVNTAEKQLETVRETERLVAEFKSGNREAFDRLVLLHTPKLYRVVFGLLGSRQDAEEVVQDAFIRAYRALDSFRGESSFETWMHKIAVNLARNRFHWNRRRGDGVVASLSESINEEGDELTAILPDDRQRPDKELESSELEKNVMKGLMALPESLRETMILRHVDDLAYEVIARQLSCKIGTVKSRLARGRELLKNYISSLEQTEYGQHGENRS